MGIAIWHRFEANLMHSWWAFSQVNGRISMSLTKDRNHHRFHTCWWLPIRWLGNKHSLMAHLLGSWWPSSSPLIKNNNEQQCWSNYSAQHFCSVFTMTNQVNLKYLLNSDREYSIAFPWLIFDIILKAVSNFVTFKVVMLFRRPSLGMSDSDEWPMLNHINVLNDRSSENNCAHLTTSQIKKKNL